MHFTPILHASVPIKLHLATVLPAFLLGTVILLNVKGTRAHKIMGWTYVALMAATAASAIFIHSGASGGMPNIAGYTPIHLFVLLTAFALPMAIYKIRRGDVAGHKRAMLSLYIGGFIVAGLLTFLPGRVMHAVFFGS